MLIDHAEITVRGGHGGHGMPKKLSGKDGGNGGDGGSVYFKVSSNINLLNQFSEKDIFIGENGEMGARGNKTGKDGKDIIIALPVGTAVYEKSTHELIWEASKIGESYLICKGGAGGFAAERGAKQGKESFVATQGERGEEKKIILNLRLIADFGLIGLPNAGKSSLLNELTNAKAQIGSYEFTTLEPNLGVFNDKVLADIPGLIEGASNGKGLGIAFLKHIEKVSVLLHCVSCETQDALEDYKVVRKELGDFKKELVDKPEIVLLTKTDMVEPEVVEKLEKILKKVAKTVMPVSIHDFISLQELKKVLS